MAFVRLTIALFLCTLVSGQDVPAVKTGCAETRQWCDADLVAPNGAVTKGKWCHIDCVRKDWTCFDPSAATPTNTQSTKVHGKYSQLPNLLHRKGVMPNARNRKTPGFSNAVNGGRRSGNEPMEIIVPSVVRGSNDGGKTWFPVKAWQIVEPLEVELAKLPDRIEK